jgi:hypothetical protein
MTKSRTKPARPTADEVWTQLEARAVQFAALQVRLLSGLATSAELEGFRSVEAAHRLVEARRAALAQRAEAQAALADPELAPLAEAELEQAAGRLRDLESQANSQVYRRISVCIDAAEDQLRVMDDWFERWAAFITFRSDDQGCGCCVHIWDVEATNEALAALPYGMGGRP